MEAGISGFLCWKAHRTIFFDSDRGRGAGPVLAAQIRTQGTQSLEQNTIGVSLSAVFRTFRQNRNRYVRMFWRWAYKKQLIEQNVMERVDVRAAKTRFHILTPLQMRMLLELDCPQWLRATFLLCGFTGLRTEELLRMDWNAVLHDEQSIHVARGVQKNSGGWTQRYVEFTEPIRRRMTDLQGTGKIIPVPFITFRRERTAAAQAIGMQTWLPNCLRHSFASYHLALYSDAGKTGHQMGHTSSSMVYRTYAQAVQKVRRKHGGCCSLSAVFLPDCLLR